MGMAKMSNLLLLRRRSLPPRALSLLLLLSTPRSLPLSLSLSLSLSLYLSLSLSPRTLSLLLLLSPPRSLPLSLSSGAPRETSLTDDDFRLFYAAYDTDVLLMQSLNILMRLSTTASPESTCCTHQEQLDFLKVSRKSSPTFRWTAHRPPSHQP